MQARFERICGICGIFAIVFLVAQFGFAGEEPTATSSINPAFSYFLDNEKSLRIGTVLVMVASSLFLVLLGGLKSRIGRSEGIASLFGDVIFATGIGYLLLALAGDFSFFGLAFGGADTRSAAAVNSLLDIHGASHVVSPYVLSVFTAVTGMCMITGRSFSKWLGWLGLLVSAIAIITSVGATLDVSGIESEGVFGWVTLGALALWMGGISVALLRPQPLEATVDTKAG